MVLRHLGRILLGLIDLDLDSPEERVEVIHLHSQVNEIDFWDRNLDWLAFRRRRVAEGLAFGINGVKFVHYPIDWVEMGAWQKPLNRLLSCTVQRLNVVMRRSEIAAVLFDEPLKPQFDAVSIEKKNRVEQGSACRPLPFDNHIEEGFRRFAIPYGLGTRSPFLAVGFQVRLGASCLLQQGTSKKGVRWIVSLVGQLSPQKKSCGKPAMSRAADVSATFIRAQYRNGRQGGGSY